MPPFPPSPLRPLRRHAHGPFLAEARQAFEAAVKANPSSAEAPANLEAVLLSLGQTKPARLELETALALDPHHAKARRNLAIALRP